MRDAVEKALRYTQGSSRQRLEDDEILRLAVIKLVEIVGEPAKQVSDLMQQTWPRPRTQACRDLAKRQSR